MIVIKAILIGIEILVSILLVGIILIQKTKSEGLGLAFGSGMGEALFGSRAGNVLTRITVILAAVFLVDTLLLGIVLTRMRGQTSIMGRAMSGAPSSASAPVQAAPRAGGVPQQAPVQPGAVPTLPGESLEDQPASAAPKPMSAPIQVETVPASEPPPAAEPAPQP